MLTRRKLSLAELLGADSTQDKRPPSDLFSRSSQVQPLRHDFYWADDLVNRDLPLVAVPSDGDFETFFADIATFYDSLSPISAYMHVVPAFPIDVNGSIEPSLSERNLGTWIALSISEAASQLYASSSNAERASSTTYAMCRRTLSYTLARTIALYPGADRRGVVEKWTRARELGGLDIQPGNAAAVLYLSRALSVDPINSDARNLKGQFVAPSLDDLFRSSVSLEQFYKYVLGAYPSVSEMVPQISGSFDSRMTALNRIVQVIRSHPRGIEDDSLAIAFFCNSILPGSLAHMNWLSRLQQDFPALLIWYGFFASISEGFDWRKLVSGVGRKLARDITRPFSWHARPECDISIEELIVLSRVGLSAEVVKPTHQRSLLVALLPGVDVFSRLPGSPSERNHSHPEADEESRRLAAADMQLMKLLSEAQAILRSKSNSRPSSDRWFAPRPKRRAPPK